VSTALLARRDNVIMHPLHELPQEEQLRVLHGTARAAAAQYGVEPIRFDVLQYEDNAVFRLTTAQGSSYVLRIAVEGEYSMAQQRSELEWLTALRAAGTRVPGPVRTQQGELVASIGSHGLPPRCCALFDWLTGEPPDRLTAQQAYEIGRATALLHRQSRAYRPPVGFDRPELDFEATFGDNENNRLRWACLGEREQLLLARLREQLREPLAAWRGQTNAWGLVHGDLHRDNLLLDGDLVSIIDFDDCGFGYYAFDLACLLDSIRRRVVTDVAVYEGVKRALLRGYESVLGPIAHLADQLRAFKALRDAITLLFVRGSSNREVHKWAPMRTAQLVSHIESYLAHAPDGI
jgi:Ser/Thr protein kinase RdoA (MazF antagonist)